MRRPTAEAATAIATLKERSKWRRCGASGSRTPRADRAASSSTKRTRSRRSRAACRTSPEGLTAFRHVNPRFARTLLPLLALVQRREAGHRPIEWRSELPQQLRRPHPERLREIQDDGERRYVVAALDEADVRRADAGACRELLLGEPSALA